MELRFDLNRESGFRYTCNRCKKCCHHKRIMLNPYELIRLAQNRGIRVAELIEKYTDEEGSVLRFEGTDNACVFLGPEGCTVHADRPLACRLYPLGRFVHPELGEAYTVGEGHPESAGVFTAQDELTPGDSIGEYVKSQGAQPYIDASEKYFRLYQFIQSAAQAEQGSKVEIGPYGIHWLHADEIAQAHCQAGSLPAPDSAESVMEAHIDAMRQWATPNNQIQIDQR